MGIIFNLLISILMSLSGMSFSGMSLSGMSLSGKAVAANIERSKLEFKQDIGRVSKVGRIPIGGFSGLFYAGRASQRGHVSSDRVILWSLTDRGPNSEPMAIRGDGIMDRVLFIPDFSPRMVRFEYDLKRRKLEKAEFIALTTPFGLAASGRFNVDPTGKLDGSDERLVGTDSKILNPDPWGIDPESIAIDSTGFIWIGEEYGPSILKVAPDGRILSRFLPVDASPVRSGVRNLPKEFSQRDLNRGFEAIVISGSTLYAFLQSPIVGLDSPSRVRVLAFDISRQLVLGTFYYELSSPDSKIGDAALGPDGKIYVLEHNLDKKKKKPQRSIFSVDFSNATNLLNEPDRAKAVSAKSTQLLDFSGLGTDEFEKLEGLAVLENNEFLIINDNDFNVRRIEALKESTLLPERINTYLFHLTDIHGSGLK